MMREKRRQLYCLLIAAAALVCASPILFVSFEPPASEDLGVTVWAMLLALIWAISGLTILNIKRPVFSRASQSSFWRRAGEAVGVAAILALASLVGGILLSLSPVTAPLLAGPLATANSQPMGKVFIVALLAGISEEILFRLALPTLFSGKSRYLVPVTLYVLITLFSASAALALMAAILGTVSAWTLHRTGLWLAPLVVHGFWSFSMVLMFPHLVS